MKNKPWIDLSLPDKNNRLWELYHENSKRRLFELKISASKGDELDDLLVKKSLNYTSTKTILLEQKSNTTKTVSLGINDLANILLPAYGEIKNDEGVLTRPLHSERSCWPVELYIWHPGNVEMTTGLYYFNAEQRILVTLPQHNEVEMNSAMAFTESHHGVLIFVTALFERSTTYFGERGYRYACMEAGQVIGHLRHYCHKHDYTCATVMEFHDHALNTFLGIDGVTHAVLGLVSVTK